MNDNLIELTRITSLIINETITFIELKNAMDDLKSLFLNASSIDLETHENQEHLYLDSGHAIGPKWASMCVEDFMRTKRFIIGINEAIKLKRTTTTKQPITVLYTGTGPYATLVMPLITLYSPQELQFIMLEVNPQSFENVKTILSSFDALDYIKEIHLCDATTFKISNSKEVDIVLVECMQHALIREPQVEIAYNLMSQVPEEVILIPEEIKLSLSFYRLDNSEEIKYFMEPIEQVFNLNKTNILKHIKTKNPNKLIFEEKITDIPKMRDKGCAIAITTEITVFRDQGLTLNESGLTIPLLLFYQENERKFNAVSSQYICGHSPEMKVTPIYSRR